MSSIEQTTPKSAYYVADYLILNSTTHLTPLHINKLVFFSHGWNLGILKKPLIVDVVEAWKYGPIIPSIYHIFKKYVQKKIIPEKYFPTDENKYVENLFTNENKKIMNAVIDVYAEKSGEELIAITHQRGSPWDKFYIPDERYIEIPNDIIKEYYTKKASENESG